MLIKFCLNNQKNLYDVFLESKDLKYLHDKEGDLSSNAVELINTLSYSPSKLSKLNKGFPKITKTILNTTHAT